MRSFFVKIFSQTLSLILAMAVSFVLLLFLVTYFSRSQTVTIKPQSTLVIDLNINITDAPQQKFGWETLEQSFTGWEPNTVHLKALTDAIDKAAKDEKIATLYLHGSLLPSDYGTGFAALRELRQAITRFKQTGKPVVAYLITPSFRDYYLTSVATTVILHPFGEIAFKGLAAKSIFLAGALEKYGIGVQILQAGKYKSAVETFTRQDMSPEDREQINALVQSMWQSLVSDIANSRGKEKESLFLVAEQYGILSPEQALKAGLVDQVAYFDEIRERLIELGDYDVALDSFAQVSLDDYNNQSQKSILTRETTSIKSEMIAIIYAEGNIIDGESAENQIGGDQFSRELRALRQDSAVEAVVIRVNSPGGSAIASEVIAREVQLLKESGKLVIVSMGTYAASGGYWISAFADTIFAEPTTITGSIGVFGLIPNIQDLATTHGITFDGVKTSRFADIGSIDRPQTTEELTLLQGITNTLYTSFITKVAQGRDLSVDAVNAVAQGRVWSGKDALRIGLVDSIGGLQDAIAEARKLAKLSEDTPVIEYPESQPFELLDLLNAHKQAPIVGLTSHTPITEELKQWKNIYTLLNQLNDPRNVYARLPFTLTVD